jgi:hypothetical protein
MDNFLAIEFSHDKHRFRMDCLNFRGLKNDIFINYHLFDLKKYFFLLKTSKALFRFF